MSKPTYSIDCESMLAKGTGTNGRQ